MHLQVRPSNVPMYFLIMGETLQLHCFLAVYLSHMLPQDIIFALACWLSGILVTIEGLQPGLMLLCAHVCSFMAGYHVHEKAILTYILPLALDAWKSQAAARIYVMLTVTGHYALLPLLFTRNEYPLKASNLPCASMRLSYTFPSICIPPQFSNQSA